MTTTAKVVEQGGAKSAAAKDGGAKEAGNSGTQKVEKRRALGRGLESLLPGPRAVAPLASPPATSSGASSFVISPVTSPANSAVSSADSTSASTQGISIQAVADEAESDPGAESVSRADSASGSLRAGSLVDGYSNFSASDVSGSSVSSSSVSSPHPDALADEPITIHAQAEGRTPANLVVNLALGLIDKNPYQTRYLFDQDLLEELADSIRTNGVVQPVLVRPAAEDGRYILILGERRLRASKIAGKATIPAMVKRVSEQQAAEMTVIENLQREDLNCLEQAEAFRVLSQQFNMTQQEIGDRVGMSRESISNYMRLLKLPERVMEYLTSNKLNFSEAKELLMLSDPEKIAKAADEVVAKHLSMDGIEDLVRRMMGLEGGVSEDKKKGGPRWVDPNVRAAQMELERALGLRVKIKDRNGKGSILIEYATVNDYDRVVEMLSKK